MTKQELIDSITEVMKTRHDRAVSKADASAFMDSLGDVAAVCLKAGEDVTLPGLGKLVVKEKAARAGRNPQTGETIQIPAKRVAAFSPAKALKDALE
ncbi:HU family DNA-binding protein [Aquitalea aquatica]|uniref:HU family DNA-binding protein n=1 Tax=Aquitalea aquatica TaxID=3044273 RepID=A0A838Y5C1_9NEIS|nr:HU family DNA-binding protein [Aquitalea magnusonii]MBA4707747.1 HU family DNA-binding protein [Aquitalea magnusonii]